MSTKSALSLYNPSLLCWRAEMSWFCSPLKLDFFSITTLSHDTGDDRWHLLRWEDAQRCSASPAHDVSVWVVSVNRDDHEPEWRNIIIFSFFILIGLLRLMDPFLFALIGGVKWTSPEVHECFDNAVIVVYGQKLFLLSLPPAVLRWSNLLATSKMGLYNHPESLFNASISFWANTTPPSPTIPVQEDIWGPSEPFTNVIEINDIDFQGHIRHLNVLGDPGLRVSLWEKHNVVTRLPQPPRVYEMLS